MAHTGDGRVEYNVPLGVLRHIIEYQMPYDMAHLFFFFLSYS